MTILTNHCSLREAQPGDAPWMMELRNNDPRQMLPPLTGTVADQRKYILNSKANDQEKFWVISSPKDGKPLGHVRWTRLGSPMEMSWESLLLAPDAPPAVGIDIMCLTYNWCFRVLQRPVLGPWRVKADNAAMRRMHDLMGFAFWVYVDSIEAPTEYHYMVGRKSFEQAWPLWNARGFGQVR